MMKEVERLSRMSPAEREHLQLIQEGLSGVRPIDQAWIDSAIDMLKRQPEFYKSMVKGRGAMLGGVSDEQMNGFIDAAASMDAGTLRWLAFGMKYLGSWAKPVSEAYAVMDKYTLGTARYILGGLVLFLLFQGALVWIALFRTLFWWISTTFFASASTAASTAASSAAAEVVESAVGAVGEAISKAAGAAIADVTAATVAAVAAVGLAADANNAATSAIKAETADVKPTKKSNADSLDAEFEF
jgi:hypothetical protein